MLGKGGDTMSNPTETNGTPDLAAECRKWESRCAELTEERDRMRAELAKLQAERDQYLKTVYYFVSKDYTPPDFTKEEALALAETEPTFAELIAELEREYAPEK
jgi:hypothetical protein